jgi:hypothetical protein
VAHYFNFLQVPQDMGYRPGLRSVVGRSMGRDAQNRDHALEFTFLGFDTWHTQGGLVAVNSGGIFSPIDPSGATPVFNGADIQTFMATSSFHSYELNYRIDRRPKRDQLVYTRDSEWVRQATPSRMPAIFGGVRVITINEGLNYYSIASSGTGAYTVFTHNNMIGPQAGLDWFYDHNDWRLGMRIKGAGLVNFANEQTQVRIDDLNGVPLQAHRNEVASANTFAFAGEINFIGNYRITNNFSFRASFDMIWVTNQALAQNQIGFAPATIPALSSGHVLFYQGGSIGFEINR